MGDKTNRNPAGQNLALHFNVLTNVLDGQDQFKAELIITNQSSHILNNNWSIYFNFLRMILPETVSEGFKIKHINGDYFSLEPSSDFTPLLPKEKVTFEFTASFWAIKTIDAPVGFYIVYRDKQLNELPPEAIPALSIGEFTRPDQVKRSAKDIKPVPTATSRYEKAKSIHSLPKESLIPIMPSPVFFEKKEGKFILKTSSIIGYQSHLKGEAQFLANILGNFLGNDKPLHILEGKKGDIRLSSARVRIGSKLAKWNSEAYTMEINTSGIDLAGASGAAVFYATQSFIQLLEPIEKTGNSFLEVPHISVQDEPQFAYRGIHLDVSRNFHKPVTIKKLMDMMSFYKLNKFHFHLTDDEGWRIEIPDLPELTEVGARRGHTFSETNCLLPSYGSGCDPNDPNSTGNGFYNRQEFIELLRYAHERHIEVIPAIDLPGHARAAVRAMEIRHDRYKAEGNIDKANEYLLTDWEDTSEYESEQMWRRNVINIGLPSSYRFIAKIVDELILMYEEADVKLSAIHVGGDEVPEGAWLKSPACIKLMKEHTELQDIHDLAEYFMIRISSILENKGVLTAGWEEIALIHKNGKTKPNQTLVNRNMIPYTWNTIWGSGGEELPYRLANLGYKVVLCNAPSLYFDLAYDKDPEEAGYYWAGYTDIIDTFKFQPLNFYKSAEEDLLGNKIDPMTHYKNAKRLTKKGQNNILGLQGQLWGETIRSAERIEYLLFPRMCALAERAWSKEPDWASIADLKLRKKAIMIDWNQFANRLGKKELPKLDILFGGARYYIPVPGAIIENGLLMANTSLPGLIIRYTTDGTKPTISSSVFKEPFLVDSAIIKLKAFTSNGRSSRTTSVENKSALVSSLN